MDELISRIEFLLHTHNCVIVPDFGGFVVNHTPSKHDGLSVVEAPGSELVFNRELTHNDGLLAESYMKSGNVSFDAAMLKIMQAVRQLKQLLEDEKAIAMGDLGSFSMSAGSRLIYLPGTFVRPDLFGLPRAALKPIVQMQHRAEDRKKPPVRRIVLRNAGIAAAAIIVGVIFFLPINGEKLNVQTARMLSETGMFNRHAGSQTGTPAAADEYMPNEPVANASPAAERILSGTPYDPATETATARDDAKKYYVVMGVFESQGKVQKATEMLNAEGFPTVSLLERYGRQHLYTASFSDKEKALTYLNDVRANHRAYRDAWILKY